MKIILFTFTNLIFITCVSLAQSRKILIDTANKHWIILRDEQLLVMEHNVDDSIAKLSADGWRLPSANEFISWYKLTFDKKVYYSPILLGAGGFTSTIVPNNVRVSVILMGKEPQTVTTEWYSMGTAMGKNATDVKDYNGDLKEDKKSKKRK